jgi:peptide chain release factor 1
MNEGTSGGFKEVIFEVSGEDVTEPWNLKRVFTVYNVFLKQKLKDVCIHQQRLLWASGSGGIWCSNWYEWCSCGFFLFLTRWTICKYYQISCAFNAYPTGLVAQCQDQKSQHKNKDKAFCIAFSFIRTRISQKTSWRCYKTYVSGKFWWPF